MAPACKGDEFRQCVLVLLLLFLLSEVTVGGYVYDRDTLLHIRSIISGEWKPVFLYEPPTFDIRTSSEWRPTYNSDSTQRCSTRKRGRRAGALVRFRRRAHRPPLPAVFLSNVRSLMNKKDEFGALVQSNRDFRDCSAYCFTETWLNPDIPDIAKVQPPGFSMFRADRIPELCHKSRGGGVCFMINERWCRDVNVVSSHCSPNLETLIVKCRPFYSPREIASVTFVGVYIHPKANVKVAVRELADQITAVENANPDTTVLVQGDFNHANLRSVLPKYKQQVTCTTRGDKILDHCYCTISGAYRSVRRAPLGRSDHAMIYLVPAYRQRLKTVKPVKRSVKRWSSESADALRGCFECTDWTVFRDSCDSLDEYTDIVTSYISFCENSVIPSETVIIYGNGKPWFSKELKDKLEEKDEAYKSGDKTAYRRAKSSLEKEVRRAKKAYRQKLEQQFASGNSRAVWQGLQCITDYKQRPVAPSDDPTLPDQLNQFYARFDQQGGVPAPAPLNTMTCLPPPFTVEESQVRRLLGNQNPRKAAGPDGVSPLSLLSMYRREVGRLVTWCDDNNLVLNVSKTKELVIDFRRDKSIIIPLNINNQEVELVESFKFLGSTISCSLRWVDHTTTVRKKAQQRMFFLRQLKKFGVGQNILLQFYRSVIESVLSFSLTTWYGSTSQQEKNDLQRVVHTASKIVGCDLPSLDTLYEQRVLRRAISIVTDKSHPANHLFRPLPSGKRYRSIKTRTERLLNSFFPQAVQALSRR